MDKYLTIISALMILYSSPLTSESRIPSVCLWNDHTKSGLEKASQKLIINLKEFFQRINAPQGEASPLALYWTYLAYITYMQLYEESHSKSFADALQILRGALESTNKRWRVGGMNIVSALINRSIQILIPFAGVYLRILDAKSIMNNS